MSNGREIAAYGLGALKKAGLDRCECRCSLTREDELNVDAGSFSLLRTTHNATVTLSGILDSRKGSVAINRTDPASLDEAAASVLEMAGSSEPDPAHDISPAQPAGAWEKGPDLPDRDRMFAGMSGFLEHCRTVHPSLILEQVILDFSNTETLYMNSNGVDLTFRLGSYNFSPMFTSRDGTDTSSFNYADLADLTLDRDLHTLGNLETLLRQSTEQVRSREFQGKFTGDVIITPECLEDFLDMATSCLYDFPLIKGTSIFRDSLGTEIASPLLTLRSMPVSEELATGSRITDDGFIAENSTVIDKGVLRTFLLSLYGARKTGRDRAVNGGGAWVVDPGASSLEEMIGSVKQGVLLCRFSGDSPSESGDFSGIAKNSYVIRDGRVMHPVKEIMLSGNLRDLLRNIRNLSRERVDSGSCILPWAQVGEMTVFGK